MTLVLGDDAQRIAEEALRASVAVAEATLRRGLEAVVRAASIIADALDGDRKVLVFGNGGSAAEAQHFAAELVGRFMVERRALPAVALTTDTSILTAIGNDYGFEHVFSRQVAALGVAGDVALGISTSGRSGNVLEGLKEARTRGLRTIGLTGGDGGTMSGLVDVHVNVAHAMTARVQEVQLTLLHIICELVERAAVRAGGARPTMTS
ncbi:MAG: SIS domain-containing protein [Vicinamibacterales bacterium]